MEVALLPREFHKYWRSYVCDRDMPQTNKRTLEKARGLRQR